MSEGEARVQALTDAGVFRRHSEDLPPRMLVYSASEVDAFLRSLVAEPTDGIRYDKESNAWVARHTILTAGRSEDDAKAALSSAVRLTAEYWPGASRVPAQTVESNLRVLLEIDRPVSAPERVAAFLRHYAAIIRKHEHWDTPHTMASAYESAALALDRYVRLQTWQPMDTMPEEGPVIVCWNSQPEFDTIGRAEYLEILDFDEPPALGWMPLPSAPAPRTPEREQKDEKALTRTGDDG